MDDQELSKALAIAIGYLPEHIRKDPVLSGRVQVFRQPSGETPCWVPFDYNAPNVVWPLSNAYDCHPYKLPRDVGWMVEHVYGMWDPTSAKTPEKAVALAIIKYHEWCAASFRRQAAQQNR